jgi:hypothetical protein
MVLALGGQPRALSSQKPTRTLEMFTDNSGFYFPSGRLLYVTVFSDRSLDYMERGEKEMVIRHRRLTNDQMRRLKVLLNANGVVGPSGLLVAPARPADRDYETNLEVSIDRVGQIQRFILRGFEPDLGRQFPQDIGELLCFIDQLRDASYRVSSGCK